MAEILLAIGAGLMAVAFLLALWRFIRGPVAVDRVIAFDILTIISVGGIVLLAILEGRGIYIDVALVYALLSFLGVIVVARFLEDKMQ